MSRNGRPRGECIDKRNEWKSPAWSALQVGRKQPTLEGLEALPREGIADGAEPYYLVDVRVIRKEPEGGGLGFYELRPVWCTQDRERYVWERREARRDHSGSVTLPQRAPPLEAVRSASEAMLEAPPAYPDVPEYILREQYRDTLRDAHGLELPEPIPDGGDQRRLDDPGWDDEQTALEDHTEQIPWCPACDCIAVPTDAGECGECGAPIEYREGSA